MPYDDQRYYAVQTMSFDDATTHTGTIGTRVEVERKTIMNACTVKDFNVRIKSGHTMTATVATEQINMAISKSLAGTGAVTPFGSANMATGADNTVIDGTVTETDFASGDDIVFSLELGTAATADGTVTVGADVTYVEKFAGG